MIVNGFRDSGWVVSKRETENDPANEYDRRSDSDWRTQRACGTRRLTITLISPPRVGMIQCSHSPRLALETRLAARITCHFRMENLQSNVAAQTSIPGTIHLSHSARAERQLDFVRAEFCTGEERHSLA